MDVLTERRERLLRFIVDEYVRTAQPVASNSVVQRTGLPVSSATIRNEMARLEDEGYIVQPHTSAGRIPSDRGYRYYVEALMRPQEPPAAVQQTHFPPLQADVVSPTLNLMQSSDDESLADAYLEGIRHILREPEFAEGDDILALLDLLARSNPAKAIPG